MRFCLAFFAVKIILGTAKIYAILLLYPANFTKNLIITIFIRSKLINLSKYILTLRNFNF
ncbi:MAG: hypothetical protein EAY66_04325 [Sphingobacteriales bacterium]|nr:MAG: hypothetical protein EAY66_04325 [Sphingobacteriales bacterium]